VRASPILSAAAVLLVLLTAAAAEAEVRVPLGPADEGAKVVALQGEYRIQGSFLTDFPVDAEGTRIAQAAVLDQRLRFRLDLAGHRFKFGVEWDLLSGQIAGDLWGIPGTTDGRHREKYAAITADGFVPRRAAARFDGTWATVEVGLVTSHWGLGMVSNDGAHDPFFGRNDFGDRVVRLRGTFKPLYARKEAHPGRDKLMLTAGVDWVVDDDAATFTEQQLAFQGLMSLVYADAAGKRLGLYTVYRHQQELEDGRQTNVVVIDGYGDLPIALWDSGWNARLALEVAAILGTTDRSLSYNERTTLGVAQAGLTGIATVAAPGGRLKFHVRGGYASGDGNPDDSVASDFTFDRDFDVGSVLFDQLHGGIAAANHVLLSDPEHGGRPPDGVDGIVTEGAFRRGVFVQPILQVSPCSWFDAKVGVLVGMASTPVRHSFYSFRAGGSPRNHHDEEVRGSSLGTELNWSLRLGGPLPFGGDMAPRIEAQIQGGHLFLGTALQAEDGSEPIHYLLATGRLRW
jgi:hypothetical protein